MHVVVIQPMGDAVQTDRAIDYYELSFPKNKKCTLNMDIGGNSMAIYYVVVYAFVSNTISTVVVGVILYFINVFSELFMVMCASVCVVYAPEL